MKSASFEPYADLPARVAIPLEIAIGSPSAPRDRLRAAGWRVTDATAVTRDPWTFQGYLVASRAEFSVAKEGYVATNSGWFSERSAGYLASGRPVVVQDTGFGSWLPTGSGAIAFSNPAEAIAALQEVESDYRKQCQAARGLAEELFDSATVLRRLIDQIQTAQR